MKALPYPIVEMQIKIFWKQQLCRDTSEGSIAQFQAKWEESKS